VALANSLSICRFSLGQRNNHLSNSAFSSSPVLYVGSVADEEGMNFRGPSHGRGEGGEEAEVKFKIKLISSGLA
jgi:hypothetical protein